tara:strand:- start:50416 stop:51732 length:1317 start_codon:yes stop_codon:yes gene_type:complete
MKHYFGTDGIRGRVGEAPITPDFMLKLGWAAGKVLAREKNSRVVIGKDTRVSGYMFESALEAGLSAAGVDVYLLGPMPTPAIAYLTRTLHAQAGIVISASHNPYYDNGIKFFSAQGTKLPDDIEHAIEAELEKDLVVVAPQKLGKAKRIEDAEGRYVEFCKRCVPEDLDLSDMKIILDCANGATYRVAPNVLRELRAEVIDLATAPDGFNINENCGSTHPKALQTIVKAEKAHVGIALDGDGDRVILVDEKGEILDGDEIIYVIAQHHKPAGVVGTVMTNLGIELALKELGIEFVRTPVGDRYVIAELEKRNWSLGGESSGHIICRDVMSTGDGIVAALQVLTIMQQSGKKLHELKMGAHKYPQHMINVKVKSKKAIMKHPKVQQAVKDTEKLMAGKGRVLLRPSGTEPVVRVMIEGEDETVVVKLTEQLASIVSDIN